MSLLKFIQLNEGKMRNKAYLLIEAFIDNIKDAHYNRKDSQISYNIGKTAKFAKFSDLELVIREADIQSIKLAKRVDSGKFAIVIDVKELPEISSIEDFLESKQIMEKVVEETERYMSLSIGGVNSDESSTDYERNKHYNSREKFESLYQELISVLHEKIKEMKKMVNKFEQQMEETGSPARKSTLKMAAEKIKDEYLGKNYKEFLKKAYNALDEIDSNCKECLDKDNKKLLDNRLKQFYEEL